MVFLYSICMRPCVKRKAYLSLTSNRFCTLSRRRGAPPARRQELSHTRFVVACLGSLRHPPPARWSLHRHQVLVGVVAVRESVSDEQGGGDGGVLSVLRVVPQGRQCPREILSPPPLPLSRCRGCIGRARALSPTTLKIPPTHGPYLRRVSVGWHIPPSTADLGRDGPARWQGVDASLCT